MPLFPARLAFADDGTPWSEAFEDVYHSAHGALGQVQHVFLAGNDLPQRWKGRERFVVLETGFGLGLNFLATWAAWRADAQRSTRLHFVSCELHPFTREDLVTLHARWPELAPLATELQARWPVLAPGLQRLHLDGGRVTLTLYFGDARDGLGQLTLRADAIYLDGFSPARNPELWSERIFCQLARLAAPGATVATWSVAGHVRKGLRSAGFALEKSPGFRGKRQMLRGRLNVPVPPEPAPHRHALIIGAGIAGCSVAERLAARGWRIDLIDAAAGPGQGASGNHAGVLRPLPSLDDNRMSRLTRAGSLYGWQMIARLRRDGFAPRAEACGVLHLARDNAQEGKMRKAVEALGLPSTHLRYVEAKEAAAIAGCAVRHGGWFFGDSGWVQPPSLCRALLDSASASAPLHTHLGAQVDRIVHVAEHWEAIAADGSRIAAAPTLILAAGTGIRSFPQANTLPVVSARGQVSLLPAKASSPPRVVVCCGGYISPEIDGLRCAGATFAVDDDDPTLRPADHAENLAKLESMLPGAAQGFEAAKLAGRVGFRPASPDRLPMVGALDVGRKLFALSGFGARGLVWSMLVAEHLASQLEGDPLPLERDLADAIRAGRFEATST